jgi:light-regulated signal transduction histidine kinase (bacteriophytochrome)
MTKSYNVLIIDDKKEEHELYMSYLKYDKKADYHFLHAYSGEEGLRVYHEEKVDCILLDNNLPRMSGLEVLEKLAQEDTVIPAIMLTGEGNEAIAVTAMKLGSQDYIPKRVITASALKRTIQRTAERSDMLHQMENARAEKERSHKDLEQFATIVAHDLKAPLRAITQHLMLVEEATQGTLDENAQMSIRFAVEGATRMRKLIDALFDYAKFGFQEAAMETLDTTGLLINVKNNLEAEIREKQATITHDDLPPVYGDAVQIQQLLQNLIGNALKYCKRKPHIHVGARLEGGKWIFSVKDNGIGIAPEHREKIFAIFRRLHNESEYQGAGVGLAVCERVVKNHGGRIWVDSELGQGSTFFFTLPVQNEAALPAAPPAPVPKAANSA